MSEGDSVALSSQITVPVKLICMRGVPGSGKSTKANELKLKYESEGWIVHVFSTDEFWGPNYNFNVAKIKEAHLWNQNRALLAMIEADSNTLDLNNKTLVIIDNTNVQCWEMIQYIKAANWLDFDIEIVEADTAWAFDAEECAKKTVHGVPVEAIKSMLVRWEKELTVDKLLKSI